MPYNPLLCKKKVFFFIYLSLPNISKYEYVMLRSLNAHNFDVEKMNVPLKLLHFCL